MTSKPRAKSDSKRLLHPILSFQKDWYLWFTHFQIHIINFLVFKMVTFTWLLQTTSRGNLLRMFLTARIISRFVNIRGYFCEVKWQATKTMYLYDTKWWNINSEKRSQDRGRKNHMLSLKRHYFLKKITISWKITTFKPIAMQCIH